ncbi:hypothetical protein [Streptomyces massasporeus]|uniref:hypothetical protein n=1 Tax=Streptomyces massasporeus TaxID=67324 RepID=UPI00365AA88E
MGKRQQPTHTYMIALSNGKIMTITAPSAQRASLLALKALKAEGSDGTVLSVTRTAD